MVDTEGVIDSDTRNLDNWILGFLNTRSVKSNFSKKASKAKTKQDVESLKEWLEEQMTEGVEEARQRSGRDGRSKKLADENSKLHKAVHGRIKFFTDKLTSGEQNLTGRVYEKWVSGEQKRAQKKKYMSTIPGAAEFNEFMRRANDEIYKINESERKHRNARRRELEENVSKIKTSMRKQGISIADVKASVKDAERITKELDRIKAGADQRNDRIKRIKDPFVQSIALAHEETRKKIKAVYDDTAKRKDEWYNELKKYKKVIAKDQHKNLAIIDSIEQSMQKSLSIKKPAPGTVAVQKDPLSRIREITDETTMVIGQQAGKNVIQRRPGVAKYEMKHYTNDVENALQEIMGLPNARKSRTELKKALKVVQENNLLEGKRHKATWYINEFNKKLDKQKRKGYKPKGFLVKDRKEILSTKAVVQKAGPLPAVLKVDLSGVDENVKKIADKYEGLVTPATPGAKKLTNFDSIVNKIKHTKEVEAVLEDTKESWKKILASARSEFKNLQHKMERNLAEMKGLETLNLRGSKKYRDLVKKNQGSERRLLEITKAVDVIHKEMKKKNGVLNEKLSAHAYVTDAVNKALDDANKLKEPPVLKAFKNTLPPEPEYTVRPINLADPDLVEFVGNHIKEKEDTLIKSGLTKRETNNLIKSYKLLGDSKSKLESIPSTGRILDIERERRKLKVQLDDLKFRQKREKQDFLKNALDLSIKSLEPIYNEYDKQAREIYNPPSWGVSKPLTREKYAERVLTDMKKSLIMLSNEPGGVKKKNILGLT